MPELCSFLKCLLRGRNEQKIQNREGVFSTEEIFLREDLHLTDEVADLPYLLDRVLVRPAFEAIQKIPQDLVVQETAWAELLETWVITTQLTEPNAYRVLDVTLASRRQLRPKVFI